jgi:hydrogenase/urease accessory protein HupE
MHQAAESVRIAVRRWGFYCLIALLLCLISARSAAAHTFTTLTADILAEDGDVSLTLCIHPLDALAIITNSPTNVGKTISHSELRAGLPLIQAYLEREVALRVRGNIVTGKCLGYIPDLTNPTAVAADVLPDQLPFLLVWTIPPTTDEITIEFNLLLDLVGNGIVHAHMHPSPKNQRQEKQMRYVDLGRSTTFTLQKLQRAATNTAQLPPNSGAETDPVVSSTSLFVWQLVRLGFTHIVPYGLDHILFVVCLFLLSPKMKPLLIQVTAFTCAHSLTLACAMLGWIVLPSRFIESVIALSIVVLALENIFIRDVKPWRWLVVFLFGLIHGLGFAGSFSQLQLSSDDLIRPLVLLNIGIEIGQLSVVAACAALTFWAWHKTWYTAWIVRPLSVMIAALALWWTLERAFAW